jgi:hypothetical protein
MGARLPRDRRDDLAPGAADVALPMEFRTLIGYGDLTTVVRWSR